MSMRTHTRICLMYKNTPQMHSPRLSLVSIQSLISSIDSLKFLQYTDSASASSSTIIAGGHGLIMNTKPNCFEWPPKFLPYNKLAPVSMVPLPWRILRPGNTNTTQWESITKAWKNKVETVPMESPNRKKTNKRHREHGIISLQSETPSREG